METRAMCMEETPNVCYKIVFLLQLVRESSRCINAVGAEACAL